MRILVVGSYKYGRLEASVARAFRRAGHETLLVDDRRVRRNLGRALSQRWVVAHCERFRPDFVFLSKGSGLELDTVARILRGRASVMWYQDPPYFRFIERPDIARIASIGRLCDVFFVTGYVAEWRALGLSAQFLPAAADRDITPVPPRPEFVADVTFIGTGYDDARARFLVDLSAHARVRVWGEQWERWSTILSWGGRRVDGRDFAAACSSSKIVLGILPRIASDATDYASDRMCATALAGGFYLGARTRGAAGLMLDGIHCAQYDDFDSCVGQVRRYLSNARERARIRDRGERFVRANHTIDQRVPFLLSGAAFQTSPACDSSVPHERPEPASGGDLATPVPSTAAR